MRERDEKREMSTRERDAREREADERKTLRVTRNCDSAFGGERKKIEREREGRGEAGGAGRWSPILPPLPTRVSRANSLTLNDEVQGGRGGGKGQGPTTLP